MTANDPKADLPAYMKIVGVVALFIVNVAFGFFASIIAVGSDGSARGIYFVGSGFVAINAVSLISATVLIVKKRQSAALMVAALTSPVAVRSSKRVMGSITVR